MVRPLSTGDMLTVVEENPTKTRSTRTSIPRTLSTGDMLTAAEEKPSVLWSLLRMFSKSKFEASSSPSSPLLSSRDGVSPLSSSRGVISPLSLSRGDRQRSDSGASSPSRGVMSPLSSSRGAMSRAGSGPSSPISSPLSSSRGVTSRSGSEASSPFQPYQNDGATAAGGSAARIVRSSSHEAVFLPSSSPPTAAAPAAAPGVPAVAAAPPTRCEPILDEYLVEARLREKWRTRRQKLDSETLSSRSSSCSGVPEDVLAGSQARQPEQQGAGTDHLRMLSDESSSVPVDGLFAQRKPKSSLWRFLTTQGESRLGSIPK